MLAKLSSITPHVLGIKGCGDCKAGGLCGGREIYMEISDTNLCATFYGRTGILNLMFKLDLRVPVAYPCLSWQFPDLLPGFPRAVEEFSHFHATEKLRHVSVLLSRAWYS